MIESGPIPAVHGVVRWRLIDLTQWIFEEFRITIAKQTRTAAPTRKPRARSRILKNVWPAPSASDFVEDAVIGLLQRIRLRAAGTSYAFGGRIAIASISSRKAGLARRGTCTSVEAGSACLFGK